ASPLPPKTSAAALQCIILFQITELFVRCLPQPSCHCCSFSNQTLTTWAHSNPNKFKFYVLVQGPLSLWQPGDELRYWLGAGQERLRLVYVGGEPSRGPARESFLWDVLDPTGWVRLGAATGPGQLEQLLRARRAPQPQLSQRDCWSRFEVWRNGLRLSSLNAMRDQYAVAYRLANPPPPALLPAAPPAP
ncbi:hypothetical protein A1O1_03762, partial [Capronia coronata CBS 617.96]